MKIDKKLLLAAALMPLVLLSREHYAKVEPYDSVVLKSAVSGQVVSIDLDSEGKRVDDKVVIAIDDQLDRADLTTSLSTMKILDSTLSINQEMLINLKESSERQEGYYRRLSQLSTASTTQKDNAFASYIAARNQYLSTQEKIESLKKQILDLRYKIEQLRYNISKKSVRLQKSYLYKLSVRAGDYVNPGAALATIQDQSKAKLTLFLEPDEIKDIEKKKVYIDGKISPYKVEKVWNSADEKFISSYRAEIYIDTPPTPFSRLLKVELSDD